MSLLEPRLLTDARFDSFVIEVYAEGIIYCSVCTNLQDIAKLTEELNLRNHPGIGKGWKLAEKAFHSGQSNPCECNQKEGFKHYLFSC